MTSKKNNPDAALDHVTAQIRDESMDPAVVEAATTRVWDRLRADLATADEDRPLRGCDDFQALIPAFVAGRLSSPRALLVGDHTRECLACRRALIAERKGAAPAAAATGRRSGSHAVLFRWAAVAAVLLCAVVLGVTTTLNTMADRSLYADIGAIDGNLQLVAEDGTNDLVPGDRIRSHQLIRTARDSGAMVRMADGSTIEMAPRSEISLTASRKGSTVNLERGNVIVHAAKQRDGRLFVATADCTVAVKGTIFSVNHGLKGSRISVIEGEVEVRGSSGTSVLQPGDQVTTDRRLEKVEVEQEIAWSRDHEQHVALLRELTALRTDLVQAMDVESRRTSTRLLDLAPADTVIYAAIPNLAEGLDAAHQVFEQHLASSATLSAWWEENVASSGMDAKIDEVLDRLRPIGEALGDELCAAIPAAGLDTGKGAVLLAKLDDPAAFSSLLADELAEIADRENVEPPLVMVNDPYQATGTENQWLVWITGDVFVATDSPEQLQRVAAALDDPTSNPFVASNLYQQLAQAYQDGVGWLFGMDVATLLDSTTTDQMDAGELDLLSQMGLRDATTLVVERHREAELSSTRASLEFDGPRRGVAAWLAPPAPMGSLEFVSADATLVASAVTKDAAEMFDEALHFATSGTTDSLAELESFEAQVGIDLRNDLAAALGGEATFAIDGPVAPIPSWKLIVEVYDPDRLQHVIEVAVAEANRELTEQGKPGVILEQTEQGGRTYHAIRHQGTGLGVSYTVVDGFLVLASQRALLDSALQLRAAGATLPASPRFRDLLPVDRHPDCSALVYRDLGRLADMIPAAALSQLPAQTTDLIASSAAPSLFCAYGEAERITLAGNGTSLVGTASAVGLQGLLSGLGELGRTVGADAVSSAG